MDKDFSESQQNAAIEFTEELARKEEEHQKHSSAVPNITTTIPLEELLKRSEEARQRLAKYFN